MTPEQPAPLPAFHPRRLVLVLERGRGPLLVTSPHLPGWVAQPTGPHGLAHAVESAWSEYAIRAYSESRGMRYDLAALAEPSDRAALTVDADRPDGQWRELDDGRWLSPAGRRYRGDAEIVQRVKRKRDRQQLASTA